MIFKPAKFICKDQSFAIFTKANQIHISKMISPHVFVCKTLQYLNRANCSSKGEVTLSKVTVTYVGMKLVLGLNTDPELIRIDFLAIFVTSN